MSAYLVGHITVRDETLWQEYVAGVKESLASIQSRIIFRGKRDAVLAGSHDHDLVVVIEFADGATLNTWYNSSTYQSLIPLRDEAAKVVIISYES